MFVLSCGFCFLSEHVSSQHLLGKYRRKAESQWVISPDVLQKAGSTATLLPELSEMNVLEHQVLVCPGEDRVARSLSALAEPI